MPLQEKPCKISLSRFEGFMIIWLLQKFYIPILLLDEEGLKYHNSILMFLAMVIAEGEIIDICKITI